MQAVDGQRFAGDFRVRRMQVAGFPSVRFVRFEYQPRYCQVADGRQRGFQLERPRSRLRIIRRYWATLPCASLPERGGAVVNSTRCWEVRRIDFLVDEQEL